MNLSPNIQLLAIAAPICTFLGALCGFIFGRKKNNAEVYKIGAETRKIDTDTTATRYERLLDTQQKQMDRMERKIERLETEQREMRKHICTSADCPNRRR